MLVGIKGHWKAPISYYLVNGLQAETISQIVNHNLDTLSRMGFIIKAITMDGLSANLAMCRLLGCNLYIDGKFQPSFKHSATTTHVFLDPCHMVKLVRNMMQNYGVFWNSNGEKIEWKFIENLFQVQEKLGLRLGNKLTRAHIDFENQKVKVKLAVQALSSSVADAIEMLLEAKEPIFTGARPTIEFLRIVDRLFDLLNSRSPRGMGSKKPIRPSEWPETNSFLNNTFNYLKNLKTVESQKLHHSRRGTCILGLCCNIVSLQEITRDLLLTKSVDFKYLLTYKFSQDHLELFFSAVRQCGGWSNNPTALQFKSIYRKLLTRAGGVSHSLYANVQPLQDLEMEKMVTTYIPNTIHASAEENQEETSMHGIDDASDNDWLSFLLQNATTYIAGWVVKKALTKLGCQECKDILTSSTPSIKFPETFALLNKKNRGGLQVPSDFVIIVIMATEKCLRRLHNCDMHHINRNVDNLKVRSQVMADIGISACPPSFEEHASATMEGIDNHYFDLTRLLVDIYFVLRYKHMAKLHTFSIHKKLLRHKCNKLVLFQGQ